ncbi:hypothetical protein ACTWQL_17795 [Pseudalkalibacillus sp. R45]|uniref:hypothetical protein n=1 Tax=Pseudalkalibacillus sp. R45 TaxID=3457433 RepID=UPI003FCE5DC8
MKRSYLGVLLLCGVLMLNIIFTQYAVHQFYFEHYLETIIFSVLNVIMFPIAIMIYRIEKNRVGKGTANDK